MRAERIWNILFFLMEHESEELIRWALGIPWGSLGGLGGAKEGAKGNGRREREPNGGPRGA